MRLLAESFSVEELNNVAWGLYAEFRPSVNEWGKRSEVRCSVILDLRKSRKPGLETFKHPVIFQSDEEDSIAMGKAPLSKKMKHTLEGAKEDLENDEKPQTLITTDASAEVNTSTT